MPKLLCYELNEVPWKVIDYYVQTRPNSALKQLLQHSHQFTTNTVDSGELHPWSTWPTMHRGVSNDQHEIRSLNQDLKCAEPFPPIWQILNDNHVSTGIFGSLQSYPPVRDQHMQFHVPDTFAAGPETLPSKYEPFQQFNLRQTGNNKATASKVSLLEALNVAPLLRTGISVKSLAIIATHLAKERVQPFNKATRSLLQSELAFDVFMNCLKQNKPDFVTFFTNHVAGMMHRYWKYTFPEDFSGEADSSALARFHSQSVLKGMDIADKHLGKLMSFCDQHDYELLVCSSMGQEAIDRGEYIPEFNIDDFDKLISKLGFAGRVEMNLAMHPNVALKFSNANELQQFRDVMGGLTDTDGQALIVEAYPPTGHTLDVILKTSAKLAEDRTARFQGDTLSMDALGLTLIHRDIGTAYHQPNGILIWRQNVENLQQDRAEIDSRDYAPTLLNFYGIAPLDYMRKSVI